MVPILIPPRGLEKTLDFQACLQGTINQKKLSPRLTNRPKKQPSNHQKTNFAKTWFLQYLRHENIFLRIPAVNNSIQKSMQQVTWKQAQKHIDFNPFRTQTAFEMCCRNQRKILQDLVPDTHVSSLLLPWSPGMPPA